MEFEQAVTAGYVTNPSYTATGTGVFADKTFTVDGGKITWTEAGDITVSSSSTIVITVKYDWGSTFEGKNPYYYYNLKTQTEADNAKTALTNLYNYLGGESGLTYTFTFTANA